MHAPDYVRSKQQMFCHQCGARWQRREDLLGCPIPTCRSEFVEIVQETPNQLAGPPTRHRSQRQLPPPPEPSRGLPPAGPPTRGGPPIRRPVPTSQPSPQRLGVLPSPSPTQQANRLGILPSPSPPPTGPPQRYVLPSPSPSQSSSRLGVLPSPPPPPPPPQNLGVLTSPPPQRLGFLPSPPPQNLGGLPPPSLDHYDIPPTPPPHRAGVPPTPPPHVVGVTSVLIAVMGITGSGKSNFCRKATQNMRIRVGVGFQSSTQAAQIFNFVLDNTPVTLIDCPGFDDTSRSEAAVLKEIDDVLHETFVSGRKLSGVIYLQSIMDNRITGSAIKKLRLFRELIGDDPNVMQNIVLTTTHWDVARREPAEFQRAEFKEVELKEMPRFWRRFVDKGAWVERFDNSTGRAHDIVRKIMQQKPQMLRIQQEMEFGNVALGETGAGKIAADHIREKWDEFDRDVQDVEADMSDANSDDMEFIEEEKERLEQLERQLLEQEEVLKETRRQRERLQQRQHVLIEEARNSDRTLGALRAQEEALQQQKRESQVRLHETQMETERIRNEGVRVMGMMGNFHEQISMMERRQTEQARLRAEADRERQQVRDEWVALQEQIQENRRQEDLERWDHAVNRPRWDDDEKWEAETEVTQPEEEEEDRRNDDTWSVAETEKREEDWLLVNEPEKQDHLRYQEVIPQRPSYGWTTGPRSEAGDICNDGPLLGLVGGEGSGTSITASDSISMVSSYIPPEEPKKPTPWYKKKSVWKKIGIVAAGVVVVGTAAVSAIGLCILCL